jgi:phospholipase/carboxylesterase
MNFTYLLRRPGSALTHRPPLLILLHGKGANEEDLFGLAHHFDPRFAVLSVRAPHEMAPGYYRWYERLDTPEGSVFDENEIEASRLWLLQTIDDAVMAIGADPHQVFLFGFSQGGAMTLAAALTFPHKLRGAVSIAGRLLPAVVPHAASREAMGHLTLLIQHGSEDAVVPIDESVVARELFADLGVPPGFSEYRTGHTITPAMLRDALAFLTVQLDRATGC